MKLEKEVKIYELHCWTNMQKKYGIDLKIGFNTLLNEEDMEKLNTIKDKDKIKLTLEVEEPILDEEERKYLSDVIRPFRDEVKHIKKIEYTEDEYIQITLKSFDSSCINLPFFKKSAMYKNMKSYKEYTLEDLNL